MRSKNFLNQSKMSGHIKSNIEEFITECCILYEEFSLYTDSFETSGNIYENKTTLYDEYKNWNQKTKCKRTDFFNLIETQIYPTLPDYNEFEKIVRGAKSALKSTKNGKCYWFIMTKKKFHSIYKEPVATEIPLRKGNNNEYGEALKEIVASEETEELNTCLDLKETIQILENLAGRYQYLKAQKLHLNKQEFEFLQKEFKLISNHIKKANNSHDLFKHNHFRQLFFTLTKDDFELERMVIFRMSNIAQEIQNF